VRRSIPAAASLAIRQLGAAVSLIPTLMLALAPVAGVRAGPPDPGELAPIVGTPARTVVQEGETLLDIAFSFGLGFEQVARLNRRVDVWIPEPGTRVELPTQAILPAGSAEGLVLNVPEMRLYDFSVEGAPRVIAVAVGEPADPTPLGEFRIGQKRVDPDWRVPESIRRERPELPSTVPAGPDNPLGDRWMTLGSSSYGIHGTNNRWSVGLDATHGCVRLYNREMRELFDRVPEGTRVRIVYQTVKLGRRANGIFIEAHPDLYGRVRDPLAATRIQLRTLGLDGRVDRDLVERTVREAQGTPVRVGAVPEIPTS
jgi:L,D-transpeptidase ErfK/SrfK